MKFLKLVQSVSPEQSMRFWMPVAIITILVLSGWSILRAFEKPLPWSMHVIDNTSIGADGVRLADINGDGIMDFVASWEEGGVTRIYVGDGKSSTTPEWRMLTVGISPHAEDSFFVDLDGDGAMDVVTSTEGDSRKLLVHWGPPAEHYMRADAWVTETLYSDGSQWMFGAAMDIDRLNGMDLVIAGKNRGASIGWLESPLSARNSDDWKFHRLSDAGWVMSLVVHDMNRDGSPDIVVSDRVGAKAGVRWLENPGAAAPDRGKPWAEHWVGVRGHEAMMIDVADLDGDGVTEIIVPHMVNRDYRLSIFRQNRTLPAGLAWRQYDVPYPAAAGQPKAVTVADVDLDGKQDIVLSASGAQGEKSGIVWLRGHGFPSGFGQEVFDVSGAAGVKFDRSLLVDVDADGDPDVVNTEEQAKVNGRRTGLGVVWYENPAK